MFASLRRGLLAVLPAGIRKPIKALYDVPERFGSIDDRISYLLRMQYASLVDPGDAKTALAKSEFRVFSQNGEDGILLYLFAKTGVTNRRFVEFGFGDGRECNTANLSINYGWNGLMMDGGAGKVAGARRYYDQMTADPSKVQIVHSFVTAENIEQLLSVNGICGEIDLLSIDIDGNDYWVWKAICEVSPRVVVIEYNATFGPDRSQTVIYDPEFDRHAKHASGYYHGASLAALAKLGQSKGYELVGCDSRGVNAFFVRKDVAEGRIPSISVEEAYYPMARRMKNASLAEQFEVIKDLDFESV